MARILGIDISSWQEEFDVETAWEAGVRFVILRAAYGVRDDRMFENHRAELDKKPEIVRGAYIYLSSAVSAQAHADKIMERANGWADFLVIDFEGLYNNLTPAFARICRETYDILKRSQPRPVILYTGPYLWREHLSAVFPKDVPYWYAHYLWKIRHPAIIEGTLNPPLLFGHQGWEIWQFTDNGDAKKYGVGGTDVDMNVWNAHTDSIEAWRQKYAGWRLDSVPEQVDDPSSDSEILAALEEEERMFAAYVSARGKLVHSIRKSQPPQAEAGGLKE